PFQVYQETWLAGPVVEGQGQGAQEHVVDLRMIGLRYLLQKRVRLLWTQAESECARTGQSVVRSSDFDGSVKGQRGQFGASQTQPEAFLGPQRVGDGSSSQMPGPLLEGAGLGWQSHRLAPSQLLIGSVQVIEQDAPGDGIDDQVMDAQQHAGRLSVSQVAEESEDQGNSQRPQTLWDLGSQPG